MSDGEQRIREIKERMSWFEKAEAKSLALLPTIPATAVYVGLTGCELDVDCFDVLHGIAVIRRVTNAPGIVHVCRAADLKRTDYLSVARYSSAISSELAFGLDGTDDIRPLLESAWHTAAMIKLRGHTTLCCPSFATRSWDALCAISDNSVTFGILDDVPRQIRGNREAKISVGDLEWVRKYWDAALDLRRTDVSRRFGLALNLSYTWNHTSDFRVGLFNLWGGLEALFADKTDRPVTRRVVDRICGWLSSLTPPDVDKSYNLRCDAVHGRPFAEADLVEITCWTDEILRQSLIHCIEQQEVPLPDWS
ncbi:MAG TPA: hypothetical protein VMS96_04395 [Terriglobales bacterium]|nr:hypothetical protein [Terriglobales bacterium]